MFYGWRVVGAAFLVAVFAWGIGFYGPPIFLDVLHRTRGWSTSLISAAITLHFLVGAAVVANLARLHARFGVPTVTRAGAVATALGLFGWAFAAQPWQLFAATWLSGAGWATTSGAALNAMVAPWFVLRRPAALSMAFNGASLGGVIFSPLWVALIAVAGFRHAALMVAATIVLVLWWLAGRYLSRTPADLGLRPDGDNSGQPVSAPVHRRAAPALLSPWRDRRFVTLSAAGALGLVAQIGLISQLFSLLVPSLGEPGAGAALGGATAAAIGGRSVLGMLMRPDADRRVIAAANLALQACGCAVLLVAAGHSPALLLTGCLLFGLGLGNVTSLPPLIAQSEFAPADVSRVVALVTALSQASYAFAPALFGLLRDAGPAFGLVPRHSAAAPLVFFVALLIQLAAAAAALSGRSARLVRVASASA